VCEEEPEELPGPCIRVEDSLAALRQIAAFYREQMPIPIVGITGSVGKTSTKEFVASVLAQKYKTHKTQGNFNNEIGVPLTLLAMPRGIPDGTDRYLSSRKYPALPSRLNGASPRND